MAAPKQQRRIRAIRAFRRMGEIVGTGSVVSVTRQEATDLITSGKAVMAEESEKLARTGELKSQEQIDQEAAAEAEAKAAEAEAKAKK